MVTDIFSKAMRLLIGSGSPDFLGKRSRKRPLKSLTKRELIQLESEIGAKLFGPVPKGGRREFFNLDAKNWIWYEEWKDTTGKAHSSTIRYEIQDQGVLKIQSGSKYEYITGKELDNLTLAAQIYHENVMRHIYKRDPRTGQEID